MRKGRFRLTIGRLMLSTSLVAVALWWAITRPYPFHSFCSATWYIAWSDGTGTTENGPNFMKFRGNSWFLAVDFPDGRTRYYLTVRRPVQFSEP